MPILQFSEAIEESQDGRRHILLGNGFSIACKPDIFTYGSLFERADFPVAAAKAKEAFATLQTRDFEVVMRSLRSAASLVDLYSGERVALGDAFKRDADGLREVLVGAIASNHPAMPSDISEEKYAACRQFLSKFGSIYTVNYDLLLYWAIMQEDEGEALAVPSDDGFRTPEGGPQEFVTWEVENSDTQNVFHLHGALYLYDAGPELKKYTWVNTGVRLIEQVRTALTNNLFPLVVAEGNTAEKIGRISHSGYLHRGLRSFKKIGGSLFLFGLSLGQQDQHILKSISRNGRLSALYVSLYGNPDSADNRRIQAEAQSLNGGRRRQFTIKFFQAESARVWG